MNRTNLSNSINTVTPQIQQSLSGFCNSSKWVTISHKKITNFSKLTFGSTFNPTHSIFGKSNFLLRVMSKKGENGDNNNNDEYYMRKGLELARNAIGCTSPNPMVGCVIVKDGRIVGQGFHPKAGQPHAEVYALRDAGELAENATAYVTLEPCNHYGKTPPCSEALIKAKVKKVVVGMVDPNPIVSSRGIDKLREAGIEVVVGIEEESCRKLNEAFIHKMLYKKPFVALRYSISVNGVLSEQLGENVNKCGGYYSKLLQEYDAVIHSPISITQETFFLLSQEPNAHQPLNIFIAKNHDTLTRILNLPTEGSFKAIVFVDNEFPTEPLMSRSGIEIVVMDHTSMDAILDYCSRQGFRNVLVDSRGTLDGLTEILGEGLKENLLQKVFVEILPFWVENEVGSSLSEKRLTERKRLKNLSTSFSGDSVLLEGYF